jgi:hypothetical protein
MSFFEKLGTLDRRWIFLFIGLSVLLPMLVHLQCVQIPSPIVRGIFDKIEALPPGSRVLLSFDYGPSTVPEIQPMVDAIIRHCVERRLKIYTMALWATGQNILTSTIDGVIKVEYPDLVYGADYVNFGYKAGNQGVINVIVSDFKKMFPSDALGTPTVNIPMMQDVRSLKNLDLIVSFGGGFPGIKEWVLFAGDLANVPVAGGCTAVSAPLLYPYYPHQLVGLMGGIKGAAEYEAALAATHPQLKPIRMRGIEMMGPQTVAHVVIMVFIIIGNVAYFMTRGKEAPKLRIHGE